MPDFINRTRIADARRELDPAPEPDLKKTVKNLAGSLAEVAKLMDRVDIGPEAQEILFHRIRAVTTAKDLGTHLTEIVKTLKKTITEAKTQAQREDAIEAARKGTVVTYEPENKFTASVIHLGWNHETKSPEVNHVTFTGEPEPTGEIEDTVRETLGKTVTFKETTLDLATKGNIEEQRFCAALLQHKVVDEGKSPVAAVEELRKMGKRGIRAEMRRLGLIPQRPTTNVPTSAAQMQATQTETLSALTNALNSLKFKLSPALQDILKRDPELAAQLLSAIENPKLNKQQKEEFLRQLKAAKSITTLKKLAQRFMQRVPVTVQTTKSEEHPGLKV